MAVNLEMNVDPSKAEAGFQKIGDAAQQAADKLKKSSLESGKAGVDSLQEQLDKVRALRQEVKELGEHYEKSGDKAQDAAGSMKSAESTGTEGASRTSAAVTRLNAAFEFLKEGVELADTALRALKENGNEAAGELLSTFEELHRQTLEIANDPRVQNMLSGSASVIGDYGKAALAGVAEVSLDTVQYIQDSYAKAFTFLGESIGVLEDGSYAVLLADQKRFAESAEAWKGSAELIQKEAEERERIKFVTEELAKIEKSKAAESRKSVIAEIDSQKHLQDIIEDTKEQLLDKEVVLSKEKQVELLETIADAEKRITELKKKAREDEKAAAKERAQAAKDAKEKDEQEHKRALERIKEREKEEIESRQRIVQAEVEMLQGIGKVKEKAEKAEQERKAGDAGVQGLARQLQAGANDERKIFETFVRDRVKAAEKSETARLDSEQAKAKAAVKEAGGTDEEAQAAGWEARRKAASGELDQERAEQAAKDAGATDEEAKKAGLEARRKATQDRGAAARKQAVQDWKDWKSGKDIAESDPNDEKIDEGEARHDQTGRDIGRAQNDIITRNVERANKVLETTHGMTQAQISAAKEGLAIAERIAREQAQMAGELEAFREWQKSVGTFVQATQVNGDRRRGQRNSS